MVLRQMMVIHRMVRSTILILAILPLVAVFLRYHFVSNDAAQSLQNIGHGNEWEANTDANASLWEVLSGDDRVSVFVDVVKKFDDIVLALSNPRAKFTIYAPVNEAFAAESFPLDLPWFYWKLLAGYHMGPGAVSEAEIATSGTVPSYVNADIFFESMQRISVQRTNARPSDDSGSVTLNHRSRFTGVTLRATNGFAHFIDQMLELPNSTAHGLQQLPELSLFRRGLLRTELSALINNTNSHVGQTLLAPTDRAFSQLGQPAVRFLFSQAGTPYLTALLKFHIVQNHTLFSDIYFPPPGPSMGTLLGGQRWAEQTNGSPSILIPTLHSACNLTFRPHREKGHSNVGITAGDKRQEQGEIHLVKSDLVAMDGVIHEVDSLFLLSEHAGRKHGWWWLTFLWSHHLDIEQIIDILDPWVS